MLQHVVAVDPQHSARFSAADAVVAETLISYRVTNNSRLPRLNTLSRQDPTLLQTIRSFYAGGANSLVAAGLTTVLAGQQHCFDPVNARGRPEVTVRGT